MRNVHHEIQKLIAPYLRTGILVLEDGTRHAKIRNIRSLDFLALAGTPSDYRAVRNFRSGLRHLVEDGKGFIFRKTGHLPQTHFA
jgi:hypothetical protein